MSRCHFQSCFQSYTRFQHLYSHQQPYLALQKRPVFKPLKHLSKKAFSAQQSLAEFLKLFVAIFEYFGIIQSMNKSIKRVLRVSQSLRDPYERHYSSAPTQSKTPLKQSLFDYSVLSTFQSSTKLRDATITKKSSNFQLLHSRKIDVFHYFLKEGRFWRVGLQYPQSHQSSSKTPKKSLFFDYFSDKTRTLPPTLCNLHCVYSYITRIRRWVPMTKVQNLRPLCNFCKVFWVSF